MSTSLAHFTVIAAQASSGGGGPANQSGDHTMMLIWGIVLVALGIAMFMVEILLPSGGVIGLAATAAVIVGVVFLFRVDTTFGLIGAIVALAALPFLIGAAIKLWPNTLIGRMLTLKTPSRVGKTEEEQAHGATTAEPPVAVKVGDTGKALTRLRPVGTVLFSGRREECLAVGGVIDQGATVRVVNIDGRQIKVKAVRE